MERSDLILLAELEKGLPLVLDPFEDIGVRIGMGEQEVLGRIHSLKEERIIRRFRARINQRRLGIDANALVGWRVPLPDDDEAGVMLASMPGVTHCYRRCEYPGRWEYTHYTVHHGWSREQVLTEVQMIAKKTGYAKYIVLFSTDEYKRSPHVTVQDLVVDP